MEEFKKCERCGNFFVSNNNVCGNCSSKDEFEITKLKNYFELNSEASSLEEISNDTGITVKNLDRYMDFNEFKDVSKEILKNNEPSDFNNLSVSL